jgi:voltage-gated sodium channel
MREQLSSTLDSNVGKNVVLGLILLNAALIGLETYPALARDHDALLEILDKGILILFTVEIFVRLFAAGSPKRFFRDPWNVFDTIVVGVCWLPFGGSYISVARLLRVLRVLRAATLFPQLRRLVATLLRSIPAMGHIGLLLGILLYGYAVIGTFLFRETVPQFFPTLHRSALTLFQVVTLEGWNEILFATLEHHPYSWIFFVSFIFLGTFITFNLFVGVIVDNMDNAREEEKEEEENVFEGKVLAELAALREEVRTLRADRDAPGAPGAQGGGTRARLERAGRRA